MFVDWRCCSGCARMYGTFAVRLCCLRPNLPDPLRSFCWQRFGLLTLQQRTPLQRRTAHQARHAGVTADSAPLASGSLPPLSLSNMAADQRTQAYYATNDNIEATIPRKALTVLAEPFYVDPAYEFVKELGQGAYGCVQSCLIVQ